jgi:hypothetical protein
MPTSYTTLLGLAKPATGELSGTWGSTVNSYITEYLDSAVAGAQVISGSQTAVTLSTTNGSSLTQAGSGSTGSAQYALIRCTGNPSGMLTVTVPATSKVYLVINATSTSQAVKIVGAGPTTGVTVSASRAAVIAWDGSDFTLIATTDITKLSGVLTVANGGTGLSSGTSGGIPYFSSTSAMTSSAALAANAIVVGGGAGAAPVTITTGTGVVTALGVNTGTAGSVVINGGVLGTPSSGTLTNATGLPIDGGTTGTLPVNRGGTGATSLASGQFLKGAGTSAITTASTVALGSEVSGTLPITNGGTGQTTAQAAINSLAGATTSGQYLRGNGSNVVMSTIQAGDVPTLNQNTTGSAGSVANAVTFTSSGGAAAGTTFNGSAARTVDYSTVGAPSTSGTGASGTWGISISGNAATATSATTATTASNGGVTSVNGQTGAVTQTSVDSIGSYTVCLYVPGTHPGTDSKPLSVGDTTAGSNLRYNFSTSSAGANDFTGRYLNASSTYSGGGTSLSGTWRCMGRPSYSYDGDLGYIWNPGLFVRVS